MCDVCCGSGEHLTRFAATVAPGGHAFGVDYSIDAVGRARASGLAAICADATDPSALGGDLDAINCAYAAYYLPDPARALAAWHAALRPGGRLVISGPGLDTNAELYAFHEAANTAPAQRRGPDGARLRGCDLEKPALASRMDSV